MGKITNTKILISQPAPADLAKSQYNYLIEKYGVKFTFNKFFDVVPLSAKEFRATKVVILDHSAVIMTSKLAVDNYFRMAKEMRDRIPDSMKFFCVSESIANYLQNYIQYRKRKIFYGKLQFADLIETLIKHKEENFLFPCSEDTKTDNFKLLEKAKIKYTKSIMYRSVPRDLTDIKIDDFDIVVMFSPIGVESFVKSFPNYDHSKIIFAAFGVSTQAALKAAKIITMIPAPTAERPSMVMAINHYLSLNESQLAEYKKQMQEEFYRRPERKTVPEKKILKKTTKTPAKATPTKATTAKAPVKKK